MYAFIHIPKTAGSTVRALLRVSFGSKHCDLRAPLHKRKSHAWIDDEDFRKVLRIYRNPIGICGHRVTPFNRLETVVPDLRYFTVLRDPLRRCVSHFLHSYRSKIEQCTPEALRSFCADPHQQNVQTRWLCGKPDGEAAIRILEEKIGFVGLTEEFEKTMVMFRAWLGEDGLLAGYKTTNRCKAKPDWSVWDDPALVDLVRQANAEDMKLYQHVVDHTFPKQVDDYGEGLDKDVAELKKQSEQVTAVSEPV